MTQKEWENVSRGTKIEYQTFDMLTDKRLILKGVVLKFNSNFSQVLVKMDYGSEIWCGRLGIELCK